MSKSTVLNQASATKTSADVSANLSVGPYLYIEVEIDLTAVVGGVVFTVDEQLPSGSWANLWTSVSLTVAGQKRIAIGPGCDIPTFFGSTIRFGWNPVTSATFSAQIIGGGPA